VVVLNMSATNSRASSGVGRRTLAVWISEVRLAPVRGVEGLSP
jgi:hypothetical protein